MRVATGLSHPGRRPRSQKRKLPRVDPFGEPGRQHHGDIMSPEMRSSVMARIRGSNTGPERRVAVIFQILQVEPETDVRELPGRPDFVIRSHRIAVCVDGDFWHGWRFPTWRRKLSEKWEAKFEATRCRDRRNHAALRWAGWTVVRLWEHEIEASIDKGTLKLVTALQRAQNKIA